MGERSIRATVMHERGRLRPGIGSDSQKPFAIVIVGGLLSRLLLSIFLAPVLYAIVARRDDVLKV
jgi:cobalt-zinc-cadmium resistance protein CzcA